MPYAAGLRKYDSLCSQTAITTSKADVTLPAGRWRLLIVTGPCGAASRVLAPLTVGTHSLEVPLNAAVLWVQSKAGLVPRAGLERSSGSAARLHEDSVDVRHPALADLTRLDRDPYELHILDLKASTVSPYGLYTNSGSCWTTTIRMVLLAGAGE